MNKTIKTILIALAVALVAIVGIRSAYRRGIKKGQNSVSSSSIEVASQPCSVFRKTQSSELSESEPEPEPEPESEPRNPASSEEEGPSPVEILCSNRNWTDITGKCSIVVDVDNDECAFIEGDEVFMVTDLFEMDLSRANEYTNLCFVMEAINGGYEASASMYCFEDAEGPHMLVHFGDNSYYMNPTETDPLARFAQN